jgi:hypothetical protein
MVAVGAVSWKVQIVAGGALGSRDVRATTAGVLLIAATAASLVATALLGSFLDGLDFLAAVAQHQDRLLTAALAQVVGAFTSAAIAISLYPVLRKHAASMALGSVGFRLIEGTFYTLSAVGTMVLVALAAGLPAKWRRRHGDNGHRRRTGAAGRPVPTVV